MSNFTMLQRPHQPSPLRQTLTSTTTTPTTSPPQTPFPFVPHYTIPFSAQEDSLLLRMLVSDCPTRLYPGPAMFAWHCGGEQVSQARARCNAEIRMRIEELLQRVRDGDVDLVVVPRDKGMSSSSVNPLSASAAFFYPKAPSLTVKGRVDEGQSDGNGERMAQQDNWQEGQVRDYLTAQLRVRDYLAAQLHQQKHPSQQQDGQQHHNPFDVYEPLLSSPGSTPSSFTKQSLPIVYQQHPHPQAPPQRQPQVQTQTQTQQTPHGHPYYGLRFEQKPIRSGSSTSVWPRGDFEIGAIGTWPQGRGHSPLEDDVSLSEKGKPQVPRAAMPVADSKEALDPRLRPKKSLPTTNSPSAAATKASNGSTSNASATQPIQGPITTLTSSRATTPLPTSQALGLYNVPTGPRSNIERAPTAPPATLSTSTSLASMAPTTSSSSSNVSNGLSGNSTASEWSHADYISLYRAIASCIPLDKHAEEITAAFNARSGTKRTYEDIMAHAADLQQRPSVGRAGSLGRSVTPQSVRGMGLASMGESERERKSKSVGQSKEAANEGAKVLVEVSDQNGAAADINGDDSAATMVNPPGSAAAAASSSSSPSPSPTTNANKKRISSNAVESTSPNGSDEQQQQQQQTSAQVGQGGGPALILEANQKRLKIEVAPSKSKVFYQPGDGSVRIEFA